jgi:pimeloyl-ACP methyl ester carboxylesterase
LHGKKLGFPSIMASILYHQIYKNANPDAPYVLFLHGAGGGTATWKKQLKDFGQKFNLILIDLPGHAQSATTCSDISKYTFEWISEKVWEVLDHYQIKQVHIVSMSLGSVVARMMQETRSNGVLSLILAGPITQLSLGLRIFMKMGLMISGIIGFRNFYKLLAKIILPKANHASSRKVFVREANALSDVEYRKWTAMYGKHLDSTLIRLFSAPPTVPTYLIVGSEDHFFLAATQSFAQQFPDVKISVVERCGHLVTLEKQDIFNSLSIKFIETLEVKSAAN